MFNQSKHINTFFKSAYKADFYKENVDYSKYNWNDLRKEAKKQGVENYTKLNRKELEGKLNELNRT